MNVIVAKTAGFCFGVKRAVDFAYSKAGQKNIYTYGPIIHNKEVTKDLEKKGIKIIDNLEDGKNGEIIIRSHGVPPSVYDILDKENIKYTDCTCPFVKKIHNIVKKSYVEDKKSIIIVGSGEHPEVVGINGECNNTAIIIDSVEIAEKIELDKSVEYVLVVQTTFQIDVYNKIILTLSQKSDNIKVNNTICSATSDRQKEAVEIASKVDIMIVLGDKNSSNTRKLYEISKKICENVYFCETISDLRLKNLKNDVTIGVTAGASTPPEIIKEAVSAMSEMENKSFEEMLNESLVQLRSGEVVKGKVLSINEDNGEVAVDLKYKSDGIIPRSEFSDDDSVNPADVVKVGDEIEAVILTLDRDERKMSLGIKQLKADPWEDIESRFPVGSRHMAKVRNFTNFGVFVEIEEGVDGLIHISDLSWTKKIKHPSEFTQIGAEIEVQVLEIDKENRRLSLGHKQLEENPWDVFETIFTVGSIHEGTIIEVLDKGAVISLPYGVEGFATPKHLVKEDGSQAAVDEKLQFKVIEFNKEAKRIILSHSRIFEDEQKGAKKETGEKKSSSKRGGKKEEESAMVTGPVEKTTLGDIEELAALKEKLAGK